MPSARIVMTATLFLTCLLAEAAGQEAVSERFVQPAFEERRFSFLDYALTSGPIGRSGFAAMLLAFALLAAAPYLAGGNRKRLCFVIGTAALLGTSGYVMFDWTFISQDLAMRDAQTVRDDCETLLKLHASATEGYTVLSAHELPSSFIALGASNAAIETGRVSICTMQGLESCYRGYIYDPKGTLRKQGDLLRSSWHRDFYLFPKF
jgi:hypothetical protein